MQKISYYPTKEHENASKKIIEIFSKDKRVMAILLTCSCARGKASKDSCLDMCVMTRNEKDAMKMTKEFNTYKKFEKVKIKEFRELKNVGKYSNLEVSFTSGKISPTVRGWTSGPDDYELEIGNIFIYSVVLFERNGYFKELKKRYVPYYSEKLRGKRLNEVKMFMFNNLDHIPLYVGRGLYFQSFSRLYTASKEFLQALFIKNRTYPISYDKWIREQVVEILHMPKLYMDLVNLLEINKLESDELIRKSEKLRKLAARYL
jgi:predicted nucleotidyltransferase